MISDYDIDAAVEAIVDAAYTPSVDDLSEVRTQADKSIRALLKQAGVDILPAGGEG